LSSQNLIKWREDNQNSLEIGCGEVFLKRKPYGKGPIRQNYFKNFKRPKIFRLFKKRVKIFLKGCGRFPRNPERFKRGGESFQFRENILGEPPKKKGGKIFKGEFLGGKRIISPRKTSKSCGELLEGRGFSGETLGRTMRRVVNISLRQASEFLREKC